MKYIDVVKDARDRGQWNEKTMWVSVESISDMLEEIKDEHKELYWQFMRKQYGIMSGYHYNDAWSQHDVSKMEWKDREGKMHHGAYWTVEQIEDATKTMAFPSGVTKWDKFVAFNAFKSDTCKALDDEKVIAAAFEFYFKDEDWSDKGSATKIWSIMCCKYSM